MVISMTQLTEKELSSLHSLLSEEELLIQKFQFLSEQASDQEVKEKFKSISQKHQKHFDSLYSQLK